MHNGTEPRRDNRGKRIWQQAGSLVAIACVLAAASWAVRPNSLPWLATAEQYELDLPAPMMDLDRALLVYEEGSYLFVDIRDIDPELDSRIPGAFIIRQASFDDDLMAVSDFLYPEDPLVLYGGGNLQEVAALASRFLERGYEQVYIMSGGIDAWQRAGGAVTGGSQP